MLCLKAVSLGHEMYSSHGVMLPVNLGRSIRKAMHKVGKGRVVESRCRRPDLDSCSSGDASASCSGLDINNDAREGRRWKMCCYRTQLEQEVQRLQQQLQDEIDVHVALAYAVAHSAVPFLNSPSSLPDKAWELLHDIATLETTVSKLEEELASLQLQLCQEWTERHLAENHLEYFPSFSPESPTSSSCLWDECLSSLRALKFELNQMPSSLQEDLVSRGDSEFAAANISLAECPQEELLGSCNRVDEGNKMDVCLQQSDAVELKKDLLQTNLCNNPNQLSEEMVRCMRNIFLCLSESSDRCSKASSSDCFPSQSSPNDQRSSSSFTSFSDSSLIASPFRNPLNGTHQTDEVIDQVDVFDPYGVNGKVQSRNIGRYRLAAEVSWMSVGKAELEYASEALKGYRFLVEQLAKVNPACMGGNERLSFWVNVYNALTMHAYLAYGVPRSDIKLFSLMQKASYIVGGHSFSAAEIEFVILKMKPPAYRPQLGLLLAVHRFKISEEHRKYSIDRLEPLVLFALSSGMYSSPAVRVFTPDNIQDELQNSMKDYIQASIGTSEKGKLLVPTLLHCFAKGIVEDSLLVDWICQHLSPDEVIISRDSTSLQKQWLLDVRSFSIIPFDPRFRYLFLPDDKTSRESPCDRSV
ncbi:hypothetical protein MUK42_25437 [Musa troglodytarum]|uniref:Ternary complex factor MIP1 n=1 Tax=Musa troglodytarum TaxID=320322 RepID=A0A9E7I5A4_9LILI|nr:hypothetical protein MUK42_25437 [Musa troglodytarum]URE42913.1 hypothetical protein MUK42_25437 [Musa troglodytarum]